jgi:hypothetical protein
LKALEDEDLAPDQSAQLYITTNEREDFERAEEQELTSDVLTLDRGRPARQVIRGSS